jgi:hypothetical protein
MSGDYFAAKIDEVRETWRMFFARGTLPVTNDPVLLDACKASIVRAMITYTGLHPHYGVEGYGAPRHDGFPPTTIALVDCLYAWGYPAMAREYFRYFFDRFVTETGTIDYYGASLAEYGQLLHLITTVAGDVEDRDWLSTIRPKTERLVRRLWKEHAESEQGLIAAVPEADTRDQVDVYFHNNAWCLKGLEAIGRLLEDEDSPARCAAYRKSILLAIAAVTDRDGAQPFIPPVAHRLAPFSDMTQDDFASYTNYRYWPELLSSGILAPEQMDMIIDYRLAHGGEVAGMTRFSNFADNWPMFDYALGLRLAHRLEACRTLLRSHLVGHTTPETWTAYESVSTNSSAPRRHMSDYCVPAQLVAPRVLAMLSTKES